MSGQSKSNRLLASLVLLLACVAWSAAAAQERVGKVQQPISLKREVLLVNGSGGRLAFHLSCDKNDWKKYEIAANQTKSYELCRELDEMFIRMATTGAQPVQYRLRPQQRYRLAWNEGKRVWDVFTIRD